MRVLITGGAGFIGSNLARALLTEGYEISVLDNLSSGFEPDLPSEVEFVEGDILNGDVVEQLVGKSDAVVHLAARGSVPRSVADPVAAFEANAEGTLSILESVRKHQRYMIFASSSSVYGRNTINPKQEEMWVSPMSPYAASKLAAESLVSAYVESYGLKALSFRFFNVLGPWQRPDHVYAAVVPKWMWRAIHDLPLPMDGDGMQSRDFTSVHTVTDVIRQALQGEVSHAVPVNLAYGNNINLVELKAAIEAIAGRELEVEMRPPRTADVQASQNNPALLRKLFPTVEPRDIDTALKGTYEWLLTQRGNIPAP